MADDMGLQHERDHAGADYRVYRNKPSQVNRRGLYVWRLAAGGDKFYVRPMACDKFRENDPYNGLYSGDDFFMGVDQDYITGVEKLHVVETEGAALLLEKLRADYGLQRACTLADRQISRLHDDIREGKGSSTVRGVNEQMLGIWQVEFQVASVLAAAAKKDKEQTRVGPAHEVLDGAGGRFSYRCIATRVCSDERPPTHIDDELAVEQRLVGDGYVVSRGADGGFGAFVYLDRENNHTYVTRPEPDTEEEEEEEDTHRDKRPRYDPDDTAAEPENYQPPRCSRGTGALPFTTTGRALPREVKDMRPAPTDFQRPDMQGTVPMRHNETIMTTLGPDNCVLEAVRFVCGLRTLTRRGLGVARKGPLNLKGMNDAFAFAKLPFVLQKAAHDLTWSRLPTLQNGIYIMRGHVGGSTHCFGYDAFRRILFIGGEARGESDPLAPYVIEDYVDERATVAHRGFYLEDSDIAHPEAFAAFMRKEIHGLRNALDTVYRVHVLAKHAHATTYNTPAHYL